MDSRDHIRRRRRVVVAGPLAPFADGLRQDLAGRGFALDTVTGYVHLLADLSGWLASGGLTAADLTAEAAGEFLSARREAGHRTGVSTRALGPVLGYLRSVQAAPPPGLPVPGTPVEELLAAYRQYLEDERGVSAGTVTHYLRYARAFLARFPQPVTEALAGLSAGQVTGFVLEQARLRRGRPPDMVTLPALRSLLRYLHAAGHIPLALAGAVPAGRRWRPALPRAASADHLRAVLASCDRESAGGRRDYAIVLAMSRLALRGGEVAGPGAKGHRYYDWALIGLPGGRPGHHWLLIRRSRRTGELAFYRCWAPRPVPLATLVQVAGLRWTIEENFQASKGITGLDQHQVRRWASWYRWVTLAMLASAFLTLTAAAEHGRPQPEDQIPLTRNEISHLLATMTIRPAQPASQLAWSAWRRRHQHRARTSHYQRQAATEQ